MAENVWHQRLEDRLEYSPLTDPSDCQSTVGVSDKLPKSLLEILPVEILQSIFSYLPISAAVSLTLCSHRMLYVFGNQIWDALRNQESDREEFWDCLQKDLPNHRLCHHCVKFHLRKSPQDFLPASLENPECDWELNELDSFPPTRVTYRPVQLVMNRHRFGLSHGMSLDQFHRAFWGCKIRLFDDLKPRPTL